MKNILYHQFLCNSSSDPDRSAAVNAAATSNKIPNSHFFFLFLVFFLPLPPLPLSKRDSSMQAPSQNSPLCAYQPSGLAQSYSTATTHHLYHLFSFCKIRSWKNE